MNTIPKIIHQIWSGIDDPLPELYKTLAYTWKSDYPTWKYEFWDNTKINKFIIENYPQYIERYNKFTYNIQRWDAIRYLILYKMGGMYVDFDYESIKPMDQILKDKNCCFALEPKTHTTDEFRYVFNNALMLSNPGHPFLMKIINNIFSENHFQLLDNSKKSIVLSTTGPWALVRLYKTMSVKERKGIYLIPSKYVTPFDLYQAKLVRLGYEDDYLVSKYKQAYAVHYFYGDWVDSAT